MSPDLSTQPVVIDIWNVNMNENSLSHFDKLGKGDDLICDQPDEHFLWNAKKKTFWRELWLLDGEYSVQVVRRKRNKCIFDKDNNLSQISIKNMPLVQTWFPSNLDLDTA